MTFFKQGLMAVALLGTVFVPSAQAEPQPEGTRYVRMSFSDGRPDAIGLDAVNAHLLKVGVRVSEVPIPESARSLIETSRMRSLDAQEQGRLLSIFALDRQALLREIDQAGRQSAVKDGGSLTTSEEGVPPYPKIYDMKALGPDTVAFLMKKFGRLHVNRTDAGQGIDEVMTIISGGPYTWFFVLEDGSVAKVRFSAVAEADKGWRISYPGLVPHGGYFDAKHGLVVAYAHGPEQFVMRYEDVSSRASGCLGDNPWIDFEAAPPKLLERAKNGTR
ncbi:MULTISPECIES: hypothetical protein [Xanthobacter]|uniref:Uncharacterized protein n=1 Tax=Xanthobacter aminoxidans TaxID=186280 RepID=A0ABW6ZGN2_9HYPH|nr:hypothetical protein [Xanthobacter sp. 91]